MFSQELELQTLAWLLTYALHSTVLLAVAWLVAGRFWKGSERASELVWKAALIGGVLTASVQQFVNVEPLGGNFELAEPGSVVEVAPLEDEAEASPNNSRREAPAARDLEAFTAGQLSEFSNQLRARKTRTGIGRTEVAGQQKSAPPAKLSYSWASLALWGWGACGSLFVFLTLLAWRRLRDHLAGRKRITEGPLLEELQVLRAKAKIRRPVRLSTCEKLSAPIATGVLFPQICLPTRSVQELDRDEGRAMLAHELAHIARLDPLWLSVGQAVQTLFFFQPLNRLARRRIDFSAEMLCDAQAVEWTGERVALARCLTKVAGWVMADRQDLPVCAMAKLRSPLAARVQGILQADERLRGGGHWALPSTAAIVVGTWMMVPGFASPQITPVMPSATSLLAASPPRGEVPLAAMGREDAPTEWPIHRVPPSEETRVASPSAVRTGAVQADALSVLLAGQNADMGALELEIAELRERMQANGTSDKAWKRLLEIEHRVSRVRALGSRVHDILNLLTTPRVPTSDAQFTPQLGDDR